MVSRLGRLMVWVGEITYAFRLPLPAAFVRKGRIFARLSERTKEAAVLRPATSVSPLPCSFCSFRLFGEGLLNAFACEYRADAARYCWNNER
jgi:hypothetical protein